jgi:hypothetical protein
VTSDLKTPELRDELAGGWPSILDRLRRALSARAAEGGDRR